MKYARSVLVCVKYKPPDTSKYVSKSFKHDFCDMTRTGASESKEQILMADLNANYTFFFIRKKFIRK